MIKKIKSYGLYKRGFTLIELLVVIAILAVLLVIVLVAINPARQTRAARNTQRKADALVLLNAVGQYFVANGSFPPGTPATGSAAVAISSTGTGTTFCSQLVPDYIAALPVDPFGDDATHDYKFTDCATTPWDTGYTIQQTAGDRITIAAPEAVNDGGVPISVSR